MQMHKPRVPALGFGMLTRKQVLQPASVLSQSRGPEEPQGTVVGLGTGSRRGGFIPVR